MNEPNRLPTGGRIDRSTRLRFSFDGRAYTGCAGDTLASALLANGVRIVGRSFKAHRPRGILSAGLEEPNAIVSIGVGGRTLADLKATEVELYDGLRARSVNAFPSARFDAGSVLSMLHRFMQSGFYYKTFMWPGWSVYEPLIRRMAGLGRSSTAPDPDRYEHRHAECDVLVVGSGPAGLRAALEAARQGRRVLLAEADFELGGSLLWDRDAGGEEGEPWLERSLASLRAQANVAVLERTLAFGYYDHDLVGLLQTVASDGAAEAPTGTLRQVLWKVRCGEVVLATGAIERPLVFAGNDTPGVMLASAAATYVNRFAVAPGSEVVVATNNDGGYRSALALARAGLAVRAVADSRTESSAEAAAVHAAGIHVLNGHVVDEVLGSRVVRGVKVMPVSGSGRAVRLPADLLCVSGGWTPTVHLFSQSGGRLRFDEALGAFRPDAGRQRVRVVGGANGDELPRCEVAQLAGGGRKEHRQWVDLQSDVTVADIRGAVHEGYVSVEHLKRYTTTGMAVDQGKTSNLNALTLVSQLSGTPVPRVGTTTFRPPYSPVTLGAFAGSRRGAHFIPLRRMPAHDRHAALGAQFANYGGWLRPECYPQHGETMDEAIRREALAARNACVLFEGSPLGKIEVRGPDAARFLGRFYINNVELPPGRVRYGIMLTENGSILDDGVFACLGEHHYQVCTTSSGAARIFAWLEEWQQCEWPDLDVVLLPVTTQYATLTVSGPRARDVVQALGTDIDCSAAAFPHLHVREGTVGGCPARVFRVSYTGESSYEINVPAGRAPSLLDRLLDVGRDHGIVPMGVETLMVLRAEKGYLHVGADTDATTLPDDVGFGAVARKKQQDFIGRRSLARADALREDRLQLVGLLSENPAEVLAVGSQVLPTLGARLPARSRGRVTSSAMSPALGRSIALALVERGRSRIGEVVELYDQGVRRRARITEPVFYDPAGARLNA